MMLDTSYVVDLLRERGQGITGPAIAFLARHQSEKLRMPLFTLCELQLGVERAGLGVGRGEEERELRALQSLAEFVETVYPEPGFSVMYARTVSRLLGRGTPIPVMDALIGSIALQHSERIVTRDVEHFRRIDGLVVLDYS